MIALVDYGAGNLTSVRKALSALGADYETPATPNDLSRAAGIIVPGVGHFAATGIRPTFMGRLESSGVRLPSSAFRERIMLRD